MSYARAFFFLSAVNRCISEVFQCLSLPLMECKDEIGAACEKNAFRDELKIICLITGLTSVF